MMNRKQSIKSVMPVLFLVVLCGSCHAKNRTGMNGLGLMSLEQQDSQKKVNIVWSNAHKDGEDLVVSGALMRRALTSYPIWRHVEVSLLAPDGTILQEARTSDIKVPRRVPGRGFNTKRFELRFPTLAPRGSSIRITVASKTITRGAK